MTGIGSLGMAELASAYPVYWSFMVAHEDYKPFAAFA
jgi:choline transport protein